MKNRGSVGFIVEKSLSGRDYSVVEQRGVGPRESIRVKKKNEIL